MRFAWIGFFSSRGKACSAFIIGHSPQAAPFVHTIFAMTNCPYSRQRAGFTMIEVMLVITLVAILTAMMIPRIGRTLQSVQVNRAAALVAGDLEAAFTMAARRRQPMRITWGGGTTYTIADRSDGTVRLSRTVAGDTDLGTMTITFDDNQVDVFPHGVATIDGAPLNVTVTLGGSNRSITMSSAGHVRMVQ